MKAKQVTHTNEVFGSYAEAVDILHLYWTKGSYANTALKVDDPTRITDDSIIFFCDVEKQKRTTISKLLLNRFPELHTYHIYHEKQLI